jgi:hypothetical protein
LRHSGLAARWRASGSPAGGHRALHQGSHGIVLAAAIFFAAAPVRGQGVQCFLDRFPLVRIELESRENPGVKSVDNQFELRPGHCFLT